MDVPKKADPVRYDGSGARASANTASTDSLFAVVAVLLAVAGHFRGQHFENMGV